MSRNETVYLNGAFLARRDAGVSVYDQGVLFGDGVFEGLRMYGGRIFKCKDHVARLYRGAGALMLDVPVTPDRMIDIVEETCRRNGLRDGYVRLVVTRGPGDLGLLPPPPRRPTVFCIAAALSIYPPEMYERGMPIITAARRRNRSSCLDPQIKSLNYLNNIMARIEADQAGVPEALMLTEEGLAAECTGDNIFIVRDGELATPPVHLGILDGITRRTVIRLALDAGLAVSETPMTLYNVYTADECFLTGTAAEIVPVVSVDRRTIGDGRPGPVTRRLTRAFRDLVRDGGTAGSSR